MQQQMISLAELALHNCPLLMNSVSYLPSVNLILIIHMTLISGLKCPSHLKI